MRGAKNVSVQIIDDEFIVTFDIDWLTHWEQLCVHGGLHTYQGVDFVLLDIGVIELWLDKVGSVFKRNSASSASK